MRKLLSPDDFGREALGMWDDAVSGPIEIKACTVLKADRRPNGEMPVFFVGVPKGMRSASIGVAWDVDGTPHVELADRDVGTDWLVRRIVQLLADHPSAVLAVETQGAVGA